MIEDVRINIFVYSNYNTIKSLSCVDQQYNKLLSQKHNWILYYQNQDFIMLDENYITSHEWIQMLFRSFLTLRYLSILEDDHWYMLTYENNQCLNFINQCLNCHLLNMGH